MSRKSPSKKKLDQFFKTLLEELDGKHARTEPIRFAIARQVQRARKRARAGSPDLHAKAVASFIADNEHCRTHVLKVDPYVLANAREFLTVALERFTARHVEGAIQTPLDLSLVFDNWRFGPGSSEGIPWTHTVDKIDDTMTCTAPCAPLVRKLRSSNPYFAAFDSRGTKLGMAVVEGSRLGFVPKNEETVRTICKEPLGNMAFQLGAGWYIAGALRMLGLDITTQQPKNQALALRGSLFDDVATIDLKSASNMILLDFIRALWPRQWYDLFLRLRSQVTILPDGTPLPLHMISSMGNGFTFPMMTLSIVALLYGYRCTREDAPRRRMWIDWTSTAVYGDDIIIPVGEYDGFVEVLEGAGFVVNHDKSYRDGPFRESCGGDYYEGVDVTPFYVKSVNNDQEVYTVINQVLDWCGRHLLVLPSTLRYLRSLLTKPPLLVPEWRNPDEGLLTAHGPRRYEYLTRQLKHTALDEKNSFAVPLAIGGYLNESEPGRFNNRKLKDRKARVLYYTPRDSKYKVVTRSARIPKGFLDGWDPRKRSQAASLHISTIVDVMFR